MHLAGVSNYIEVRRRNGKNGVPHGAEALPKLAQVFVLIGQLVRQRRKEAGMTLKDAAALAGVGVRFLSELERGKPTLQLGLAISVLQLFGLELHVEQRGDQRG